MKSLLRLLTNLIFYLPSHWQKLQTFYHFLTWKQKVEDLFLGYLIGRAKIKINFQKLCRSTIFWLVFSYFATLTYCLSPWIINQIKGQCSCFQLKVEKYFLDRLTRTTLIFCNQEIPTTSFWISSISMCSNRSHL